MTKNGEVFKEEKYAQINDKAGCNDLLFLLYFGILITIRVFYLVHQKAAQICDHCRREDQKNILHTPAHVKVIARCKQKQILPPFRNYKIQQYYNWKEHEKTRRIK